MKNYIDAYLSKDYVLGVDDCATFVFDYLRGCTGIDALHRFRGYRSQYDIGRLLVEYKCADVAELIIHKAPLKFKLNKGHCALVRLQNQEYAFALPYNNHAHVAFTESGIEFITPCNVLSHWEVM